MATNENEMIGRAQAGDADAFCQLARGYERRVYLLALHYCRDPHDAEDLSQEVWLKAYRSVGTFRGEASFYTWLRQIMINSFLNYRRGAASMANGKQTAVGIEELDSADGQNGFRHARRAEGAEDRLHRKILVGRVMQALGELTPQQRLVFLLKHREGMTYEEISKALGCSTGTIKKSLFRAVAKLRQHLGVSAGADCAPIATGEGR